MIDRLDYTDAYTEEDDKEGLQVLRWSMFDCPHLGLGSGKRYMERLPVRILDDVCREERLKPNVMLAYVSKSYADRHSLPERDPHRVGLAVKLKVGSNKIRFKYIRSLIVRGVSRIKVSRDFVYFDVDDLREMGFFVI